MKTTTISITLTDWELERLNELTEKKNEINTRCNCDQQTKSEIITDLIDCEYWELIGKYKQNYCYKETN